MARKSEHMTERQRQCQRIMRDKAAMKKRRALLQKCSWVGGIVLVLGASGGSFWAFKSGAAQRFADTTIDGAYGLTARAGFVLQDIYLEGRERTAMHDIEQALAIEKGAPILRLSLTEARARLEKIDSVKMAAVERALPGTLYVRIVEREPVALWQYQGQLALVDDNGAVMRDVDRSRYPKLPLIVGEGAPKHVEELMRILAAEPVLAAKFASAIRVGERRWNIRLQNGVEVRLPETDAVQAWKKLAELDERQQLLARDVKVIDLRLQGRLFITTTPEESPVKATGAKET